MSTTKPGTPSRVVIVTRISDDRGGDMPPRTRPKRPAVGGRSRRRAAPSSRSSTTKVSAAID